MKLRKKILSGIFLPVTALLTACSGSTEDVRLTLCKDLTGELLGSPGQLQIVSEEMVFNNYEDLEVQLKYKAGEKQGRTVCFYTYETNDENVMDHVNPAEAFSTYPNRVVLDDATVDHKLVAQKINAVLLKQGKAALDSVKKQL